MFIKIHDLVTYYHGDVFVDRAAIDATPERLHEAVKLAYQVMGEYDQVDFGPLAERWEITYEEFLWAKRETEIAQAGRIAKRGHTKVRRADFNAKRSQLALVMLAAGVLYKCAFSGCEEIRDLTVDHIRPLSRGGDDGVANLQFLCRSHNSAKGDRLDC